jgi:predicted transcriptional regulator
MAKSYLVKKVHPEKPPANIFADKSALLLHSLLHLKEEEKFQIREIARSLSLSHGLVQRVVYQLVHAGIIESEGQRTAKKYRMIRSGKLLRQWISMYSILKKCILYNYASAYSVKEIEKILKAGKINNHVLALHSATRFYKYSFTNLSTLELYIHSDEDRITLEKKLYLEPQETGYKVLLIKPYYKSILYNNSISHAGMKLSSPILTFLDLYDFPLRGREQAEYLLRKHPALEHLYYSMKNDADE